MWGKQYGNPAGGENEFSGLDAGNPALIYDECWGIQPTDQGGAVIACGTGIEGCDEYESGSAIAKECQEDPRTKWRSLLIEVDETGEQLWSRTDSYLEEGSQESEESAAEHVIRTQKGSYAAVIDQGFGIGLIVLE